MRTTSTTEPYIIDLLSVVLTVAGKEVFTAEESNVGVTVDFDYTPGHPGRTWGSMERAEEPIPSEITITAIRPVLQVFIETGEGATLMLDAGRDLQDLLTDDQIADIRKELFERADNNRLEGSA